MTVIWTNCNSSFSLCLLIIYSFSTIYMPHFFFIIKNLKQTPLYLLEMQQFENIFNPICPVVLCVSFPVLYTEVNKTQGIIPAALWTWRVLPTYELSVTVLCFVHFYGSAWVCVQSPLLNNLLATPCLLFPLRVRDSRPLAFTFF